MQNNACEETKNFFNHIVPFIEKKLEQKWGHVLKSFKRIANHKSLNFLNELAEEVHNYENENKKQAFLNDFENLIKRDVRSWAMNHIKLDTTYVVLNYADALITVMNNPMKFKSIKKAK